MTPLRNQRTVTPCRRWPSQWQTVHRVHPTMNCITLRTNKAFYHLPKHRVSVCVCVAVSSGKWLFTHGLMEKYIIVPIFQLHHNTMKVHVWSPKVKRIQVLTSDRRKTLLKKGKKHTLEERRHEEEEAACQSGPSLLCCSHTIWKKSLILDLWRMWQRLSYLHDTPPHTFYNHSLFLDETLSLRVGHVTYSKA